ncbi:MAG: hypothetical protein JRN15_11555, partial [Nitrososphaerota archaeon]|nr:hypothetical protein [Nitrososphaerota archaeon]
RARRALLIALVCFACFETFLAVSGTVAAKIAGGQKPNTSENLTKFYVPPQNVLAPLWIYSTELAASSWVVAVFGIWKGDVRKRWQQAGFDKDIFKLMTEKRGSHSRLALLKTLDSPRHKTELSQILDIDWKEVSREVAVLENLRLIGVIAQSGAIKMYELNEKGKQLLCLLDESVVNSSRQQFD